MRRVLARATNGRLYWLLHEPEMADADELLKYLLDPGDLPVGWLHAVPAGEREPSVVHLRVNAFVALELAESEHEPILQVPGPA